MTRLLGLDPGLQCTGYGVIESDGHRSRYLGSGRIRPGAGPVPQRLGELFAQASAVVKEYTPHCAVVETCFLSTNPSVAIKLGQARGALICACSARQVDVFEYAPRDMKRALTGRGNADKQQVQYMVTRLLELDQDLSPDEADALGLAICHAHKHSSQMREAQS